ncbi:MAG: flagellar motor switch protein FliN [Deltaproteobacteria bacterium]|nr:flagellar motor switch protein FliN [Deltaproteobacteria bacterium]
MSTIENFDLQSHVNASVVETFATMMTLDIKPVDVEPPPGSGVPRMVGTLNFAGNVSGIFNVQTTIDFGRLMASGLLGMAPEEVNPASDIRDLLAEITNIIGGNLKSALNDAGHACILSTPSITYGTDFTIKSLSMDRFARFAFQHAEHALIVEVGLKSVAGADGGIDLSSPDAMSRLPDVDIEKLNALDYKTRLSEAAANVFDTMLSLKLESMEAVASASLTGIRDVSSVCFAGDANGIVSVHVPEDLARIMAANMLGMEPEEIEGHAEIEDLLGELGNIVGGNLKSALTDAGLRCALSTPSFTTGTDFMIESLNLERYERYAFQCEGRTVFVEMGIKISDLVKSAVQAGKGIHYEVVDAQGDGGEEPQAQPKKTASAATSQAPAGAKRPIPSAASRPAAQPPPSPAAPATAEPAPALEDFGLEILLDIPVDLTVELGRTKIAIQDLLRLGPGAPVKLAKLEGEPVDILANDVLIARGEVVVRSEKYGIRITEITSRMDRLKGLR